MVWGSVQDVIIPELMKKLDILGDNGVGLRPPFSKMISSLIISNESLCVLHFLKNLRNEEQVAVIQAGTVISLCEKVSRKPLVHFAFADTQWTYIVITPFSQRLLV